MKGTKRFFSSAILVGLLLGQPTAYAGDVAPKTQTTLATRMAHSASNHPKTTPGTHYADGTGDMLIDRLNESQLDQNYKGSVYYLGQPISPFKPIDTECMTTLAPQTTKNTISSHTM